MIRAPGVALRLPLPCPEDQMTENRREQPTQSATNDEDRRPSKAEGSEETVEKALENQEKKVAERKPGSEGR